ncbi:CD302 antigen isoform X5 [Chrysemys picta bellii]|uniref:CD302 antigen isoform X5 n=1 Tax=Chrysemys picta bellii TaxID=8478 RepID=UPI0032B29F99
MPHGPRAGASPVGSGALACRAWQLSGAALPASAPGCPRSGWCPAGALLPPAGAAFREPARSGVSRGYGAPFPRAALPARPPRHRLRSSRASLQGGFQPELKQSPDSNSYSQPECPSSAWIPFRSSCYIFLQGTFDELDSIDDARNLCKGNASGADIISIKNKEENTFIQETFKNHWQGPDYISLGMFFDTDDNAFKWFDKSEMKFTNWIEEESNEELLNTCASMCTKSGEWRKISCEDLPLTGTLCKTAFAYEKKYLPAFRSCNLPEPIRCGV